MTNMLLDENVPIIVGVGQFTDKLMTGPVLLSPIDLMEKSVKLAMDDAGVREQDIDTLSVVDTLYSVTKNLPEALSNRLGIKARTQRLAPVGGNAPQLLVNKYAEQIAQGKATVVVITGGEALKNARKIIKSGETLDWSEPSNSVPSEEYPVVPMGTPHEKKHGIWPARHIYPLFENALRGQYGQSIDEHQASLGVLLAKFSEVAAQSKNAWLPVAHKPEKISRASSSNRYVGWPYTKYMNAMNQVNQSASLVMTSVAHAKSLGIDSSKWVYLHGCADVNDLWYVTERENYYSSPAIRKMSEITFEMAGKTIADVDFIDLYSCFPSVIQIARDELDIAKDDPRPLTVTGGLPFHGGAGSSYVLNSIATMCERLRSCSGSYGLVTANGGLMSEHAAGLYSTEPVTRTSSNDGRWTRQNPSLANTEIAALWYPSLAEAPVGEGVIETYTVAVNRVGSPERGIIIGRLTEDPYSPRFIANTPIDVDLLTDMMRSDYLFRKGRVENAGGLNTFMPY